MRNYLNYHIISVCICLGAVFMSQGVSAQLCPPETLRVELEAKELGKNVNYSVFRNDSVVPYINYYLEHWLKEPVDGVEVLNEPPLVKLKARINIEDDPKNIEDHFYTYYNSKNGVENFFLYNLNGRQYTCPLNVKVIDKYHPYCAGRRNEDYVEDMGTLTVSSSCTILKDVFEEKFQEYTETKIFTEHNDQFQDKFWAHQYYAEIDLGNDYDRKVRPAWIEWDSTYAHWTELGNTGNKKLEIDVKGGQRSFFFYFVYYDENGNRALDPWAKPCRGKITVKIDEIPEVDFLCPASYGTFLAGKRVELPYPDVSPNEYVHWENVDLYDSDGVTKLSVTRGWMRDVGGFYVNMPPSPGNYFLKLKGWVCGDGNHVKELACPVKVIKAETHCNTN